MGKVSNQIIEMQRKEQPRANSKPSSLTKTSSGREWRGSSRVPQLTWSKWVGDADYEDPTDPFPAAPKTVLQGPKAPFSTILGKN